MSRELSYIEISKGNLLHNFSVFKSSIHPNAKIISVIKANAYGHGLIEVVTFLEDSTDWFQVDDIEELRLLRTVSKKPVLVAGYILLSDLEEVVDLQAIPLIYDLPRLRALDQIGADRGKIISVHIKIDALLGRQGVLLKDLPDFIVALEDLKNVSVEAICSHFSNIEDTADFSQAQRQIEEFNTAWQQLKDNGFANLATHQSATSGVMTYERNISVNKFVRIGIGLYGLYPSQNMRSTFESEITLKPVMRWVSHIAQVKELPAGYPVGYGMTYVTDRPQRVALVPQGYSDGYDRGLSNVGEVLISGVRCKVLGRIAMNMFVVDLGDTVAAPEDEVVLLGAQLSERITAEEIADKIGSINYEVVARVSPLLKRVVV